jgi:hypothetical protein
MYVCMYVFFLLSMLHYSGVILHTVSIHIVFQLIIGDAGLNTRHCYSFTISVNEQCTIISNYSIYTCLYIYLPYYNWSKSIEFIKFTNDFWCFVIS